MRECNRHLSRALAMACQLTILADEGEAAAEDNRCRVLYGIIRDCAYRIRREAESERERHRERGIWDEAQVS